MRTHSFARWLWLAAILSVPATASAQDESKKAAKPPADAQVLEELKALKATVAKLQAEIQELRTKKQQAEVKALRAEKQRQEEATQKYAKAFTATFLDLAMDRPGEGKDAARMLTKDLRSELGLNPHFYTSVLGDGFKSWTADSHDWAPNLKAVIVKGKFNGSAEKKDITVPFVLHLEMEGEQWRVSLFRVYFNLKK